MDEWGGHRVAVRVESAGVVTLAAVVAIAATDHTTAKCPNAHDDRESEPQSAENEVRRTAAGLAWQKLYRLLYAAKGQK